ncbi:putative leader peptide [Streptomyces racemochromogenes]
MYHSVALTIRAHVDLCRVASATCRCVTSAR